MGAMKEFDRRIRAGGDDAVRAALDYALTVAARWIPVEERLPEEGADVLVASPCPNSNVPNIDIASWGSEGEQEIVWRESDCGRIYPTHWMPLPSPPDEAA